MAFRKFLISIIKSLIVLILATLIFSTVSLDLPALFKGFFKDIFQYSSPEMQKDVIGKLSLVCSSLDGKDISGLQQQMSNFPISLDFSKIGALCKDYNSGKLNDKEFFFNVIGSAFPEKFEFPKSSALEKYNMIMDFLNKNKSAYIAVLAVLLALLYLLIRDIKLFAIVLTGTSFSMGILILLPYVAIIAYDKFVGIDTTPILASVLGGSFSFDAKGIISVILLLILRTYSSLVIALGIVFLSIGIVGKVYSWRLKRQIKKSEIKTGKKSGKESKEEKTKKEKPAKEKQSKEDEEESYKHRDRSTKEILDELDGMPRKKKKED